MNFRTNRNFYSLVILLTVLIIAIQIYWNYSAYETNKAQYIFKVQKAFDQAVNAYYFQLGKSDVVTLLDLAEEKDDDSSGIKSFLSKALTKGVQSISFEEDSIRKTDQTKLPSINVTEKKDGIKVVKGEEALNQSKYSELRKNQMTIRVNRDSLDFNLLEHVTDSVFLNFKLKSNYNIYHFKKGIPFDSLMNIMTNKNLLDYSSQSDYLESNQEIKIRFNNTERQALFNGLLPLLLSLGFSMGILLSIIKLIDTIKKQKNLSDIKDDFISNITHEFKTPIATASAAIEVLDKFDLKSNPEKAKQYLNIANQQLQRLDGMVEKILELSSLDTDKVMLVKETQDAVQLLKDLVKKLALMAKPKEINFTSELKEFQIHIDTFYFTSAVSNLIENAIKHGGERIEILLQKTSRKLHITVRDNGESLRQEDEAFIFDKFSRKSYGNTYEIKGNGIGLYFTKKIIEKHDGNIRLEVRPGTTAFIITL